jgi:hypothetical protein
VDVSWCRRDAAPGLPPTSNGVREARRIIAACTFARLVGWCNSRPNRKYSCLVSDSLIQSNNDVRNGLVSDRYNEIHRQLFQIRLFDPTIASTKIVKVDQHQRYAVVSRRLIYRKLLFRFIIISLSGGERDQSYLKLLISREITADLSLA